MEKMVEICCCSRGCCWSGCKDKPESCLPPGAQWVKAGPFWEPYKAALCNTDPCTNVPKWTPAPTTTTTTTTTTLPALDCQWSSWGGGGWGGVACSKTCGGGFIRYSRRIIQEASKNGKQCDGGSPSLVSSLSFESKFESKLGARDYRWEACNTDPCPATTTTTTTRPVVDCEWSRWEGWGECDKTCGTGTLHLRREIIQHPTPCTIATIGTCGRQCGRVSKKTLPCNTEPCPKNCEWSSWALHTLQDGRKCDGGNMFYRRHITQYPDRRGRQCNPKDGGKVEPCNLPSTTTTTTTKRPAVDCQWSSWAWWNLGMCDVTCGGGKRIAYRTIIRQSSDGGKQCGNETSLTQPCNYNACPKPWRGKPSANDCQWSSWTLGSLLHAAQGSSWGSECDRTCGGGKIFYHRTIIRHKRGNGRPCGNQSGMVKECNPQPCPTGPTTTTTTTTTTKRPAVHCQWSSWTWSNGGVCTKTCGWGKMYGTRKITRQPSNGGKPCGTTSSIEKDCNTNVCPTFIKGPKDVIGLQSCPGTSYSYIWKGVENCCCSAGCCWDGCNSTPRSCLPPRGRWVKTGGTRPYKVAMSREGMKNKPHLTPSCRFKV